MFSNIGNISKKLKIAKDLIVNANKIIPLLKEKADELFKYEQELILNDGLVKMTLNGKLECIDLKINPELLRDNPEAAILLIKSAISTSNQNMLEHIIEECKKTGKGIDPDLMNDISSEIDDEMKKHTT